MPDNSENRTLDFEDGSLFDEDGELFEAKGLFSKYFIEQKRAELIYSVSHGVAQIVWEQCRQIYERAYLANRARLAHGGLNESDTESELIDPILSALGFAFLHRTRQDTGLVPDYILYPDESTKDEALNLADDERYRRAIGILEAKSFNKNLGSLSKKETPGLSYQKQVRLYLDQGRNYFHWGILTNGQEWRLYCSQAKRDDYFSLSLRRALNNLDDFKLFLALFGCQAFIADLQGSLRLDRLRDESDTHQQELESNLRQRVYVLVEWIAQGFYENSFNRKEAMTIEGVYNASLILLYRLMFILYAEARGLLPALEHRLGSRIDYRKDYSLQRLIPALRDIDLPPEDDAHTTYWFKLVTLFEVIDGSNDRISQRLGIPRYNGGLFDYRQHPELGHLGWRLGDWTVQETLKRLMFDIRPCRDRETIPIANAETIDYSTLSVQQLGSIYEGLLEHKPVLNADSRIEVVPESEERWLTGSYYTPGLVVDYIVQETLKPLLDEIEKSEPVQNAEYKELEDNSFAQAVLRLRILDPAMGSGHFLVGATEYLADEIAYHPTTKTAVARAPRGMNYEWAERAYWRRRIVESCIYGVDKNELAVELARLSLWLTCISSTNSLSFLDHHLKTGDSLTGAWLGDMVGKYRIEGLSEVRRSAVDSIANIVSNWNDDYDSVKIKETLYNREVASKLEQYERLLDYITQSDMAEEEADEAVRSLEFEKIIAQRILHRDIAKDLGLPLHFELAFPEVFPPNNDSAVNPQRLTDKKEHPPYIPPQAGGENSAVDYGESTAGSHSSADSPQSAAGFDAIISNPPYVRQESLGSLKWYLKRHYKVYRGTADLFVYFIERALSLLKPSGRLGMIMSNKWMRAAYGEELRRFIKDYQIEKLVDFPRGGVFKGVGVSPAIMIAVNTKPQTEPLYARIQRPPEDVATLRKEIEQSGIAMHNGALAVNGFALVKKDITDILEKMKAVGAPLEEYVEKKIFRGLITGLNEAFIIDSRQREELIETDSKSEEIIVPVLKGEDVCKWKANYRNRYLILTKIGVDIDEYPGVFEYLQKFSPKIEKRLDQGKHWWELRACKYYESFITEKIIWPDISQTSRFAWDNEGYYCTNTAYFISTKNTILLSLLNSKLIWKWLSSKTAVLGDPDNRGGRRLFTQYIKKIPIFSPFDDNLIDKFIKLTHTSIDTQSKLNQSIGLAERRRLEKQLSEAEAEIDSLVYQLYGLTSQEIDIIERR